MRGFLLLPLLFAHVAFAQEAPTFQPDHDGDGCYTTEDLTHLLGLYGSCTMGLEDVTVDFHPYSGPDSCFSAFDLLPFLSLFGTCTGEVTPWSCGTPWPHQDFDYTTVAIGDQCWFVDNLRATTYTNGDPIDLVTDPVAWTTATAGSMVIYGEGNGPCTELAPIDACDENLALDQYGRLYNGHAALDPRGLCPAGWHVPSDADWTTLEDAVGAMGYAGTEGVALKSTTGWYNNGNGDDAFGFNAVPGGYRFRNSGLFLDAGSSAYLWSSTPSGSEAWVRYMNNGSLSITRYDSDLRSGMSVRCVHD